MIITYKEHKNQFLDEVRYLQNYLVSEGYMKIEAAQSEYGYFKLETEKAFKKYQSSKSSSPNGIYDTSKISNFSVNGDDVSYDDNNGKINRMISTNELEEIVEEAKEKPFFNDDKENILRKGTLNIEINYSNSKFQRRIIEGVKIRSLGQSIDANGEAISDVYEFIGRDIIEKTGGVYV